MSLGQNIKRARQAAGWSQTRLGKAVNVGQSTVSSWEVDRTEPTRDDVRRVAQALEVPLASIELPEHADPAQASPEPRPRGYPMVGKVGAGGTGEYADDYAMGAAAEYIEALPGMPTEADIIALTADGDSMAPLIFHGDLAFFGPTRKDVESLINQRVMARLADGRKFFKILKRGSRRGLWTLRSLNPNTPDIEDVKVAWVLPYQGSRPRQV